jgi:hypothetical protein
MKTANTLARWVSPAILLCGALFGAGAYAQSAQGLATVGPIDPGNGYPQYYQDRTGLALEPCLVTPNAAGNPVTDPCGLAGTLPGGDASAIVFPSNFPDEFFYALANGVILNVGVTNANKATLVMALEGAFGGPGTVAEGQQIVFARFRIRVTGGLVPGASYTLTYPYGVRTFQADAAGVINFTDDQGCGGSPCAFDSVLASANIGPFLKWDPAESLPPVGYIGDPNVDHSITGSPLGTNFFRIEGPNIGGSGINVVQTNLFSVTGKQFNGVVASALTIDRTSYVRASTTSAQVNVFAHAAGNATLIASGTGIPSTVLTADGATGRFFAQIIPSTPATLPAFIRITASAPGADNTVRDSPLVDEVTVTQATFDKAASKLTIKAVSSDLVAPAPTLSASTAAPVVSLGTLDATGTLVASVTVPSASISVTSSKGGVGVLPVSLAVVAPPGPVATTTTLTSSLNPSRRTQAVTFTARVTPASGTAVPTGTVTFRDGTATLGTGTLNATGVATFTTSALSRATHSITAVYGGATGTFTGSTSNIVSQVVTN